MRYFNIMRTKISSMIESISLDTSTHGNTLLKLKLINRAFNGLHYLNIYPDLSTWKSSPLSHYVKHGWKERRAPNLFFDAEWYFENNKDIDSKKNEAISHYLSFGEAEGRWPHPLFNPEWYLQENPDAGHAGGSPFLHFLSKGLKENRNCSPFFNVDWYLKKYPAIASSGTPAILHFLQYGHSGDFDPNPDFCVRDYLSLHPDVAESGLHPYLHYLKSGRSEGRRTKPITIGIPKTERPSLILGSLQSEYDESDVEPPNSNGTFPNPDRSGVKLFTFDVWDTLLHRECHPDEIKLQSARSLRLIAPNELRPAVNSLRDLYWLRIQSENRSAPNNDFEYRLTDALDRWLSVTLYDSTPPKKRASIKRRLLSLESIAESRSVKPNTTAARFIDSLDIPYIFISDFYGSTDFIRNLLTSQGVGETWPSSYSSSDHFENKRSGKLFERVLNEHNLRPDELCHIGDNEIADLKVPSSLGIRAVKFTPSSEIIRNDWYGTAFKKLLDGDLEHHERRILALSNLAKPSASAKDHDILYKTGVEIAPLIFSFCLSIIESTIQHKSKNVFFFTREGIFLKQIYDAICNENPFNMEAAESKLISVSRRATFAASLSDFNSKELMRLWSMYGNQSPRGLAASLNLDFEIVKEAAVRCGLEFSTPVHMPWADARFSELLADKTLKAHAQKRISEQKQITAKYLRQAGFPTKDDEKALVVDIGWRGTIQDNIAWLTGAKTVGHYLGLLPYLNEQPPEAIKKGWLGNPNCGEISEVPHEVAGLEMLLNGNGGSTLSYKEFDGKIEPVNEIIPEEEAVVDALQPFRDGVLAAIPHLSNYVRLHGLQAEHLRHLSVRLARGLAKSPPPCVADLFGKLVHNEMFGTGALDELVSTVDLAVPSHDTPRQIHHKLENALSTGRWPESIARRTAVAHWYHNTSVAQRVSAPLAITQVHSPAVNQIIGEKLSVYVPSILKASGGHRTIFNMVRRLADIGLEPHIFLENEGDGLGTLEDYLGGTNAKVFSSWSTGSMPTAAFATVAHSAGFVASNCQAHHKFYLVQDAEALFNPVGDEFVVAENSYSLGLNHITIGNWLTHIIRNEYSGTANPAGLGIDARTYYHFDQTERENAVCMLYQPEKPRRGNKLAIDAIRILKSRNPEVKIYLYGSDRTFETGFEYENLGVITSLHDLNTLYNKCRAGICISLTNPSRIPYEMMASGCLPVDVYRHNNLLDHENETILLAHQSADSLALGLEIALEKNDPATKSSIKISDQARQRTLNWENDTIVGNVLATIEGSVEIRTPDPTQTYTAAPIIAPSEDSTHVRAYCSWQSSKAGRRALS